MTDDAIAILVYLIFRQANALEVLPSSQNHSDELQSQLDELDHYIAELTQTFEPSGKFYLIFQSF